MNILIAGGGKLGAHFAALMLRSKHQIRIIELHAEHAEQLRHDLPLATIVLGSATDPAVLEANNIRQTDVVTALTGSDETNLIIASLARFEFGVPHIVARVNNPKNAWMFTPAMGVDVALNLSEIAAKLIAEQLSSFETSGNGRYTQRTESQ